MGLTSEVIEENKRLVKEYPFLIPRDGSGEVIEDFSVTMLDAMPTGWRIAFGEDLCRELKEALEKENLLYDYRILQIKEKFGELRWYDYYGTKETDAIIDKYADISARTCIICGEPATKITMGWICPYCDDCCDEKWQTVPIEETKGATT